MIGKLVVLICGMFVLNTSTASGDTLVLQDKNTVVFRGVVDDDTVTKAQVELAEKAKAGRPLYLVLDTPGGSVEAGIDLIEHAKALGVPVHTVTIFAASMGFQTVQGLGNRYITSMGTLMSHRARGGMSGEFPGQLDNRISWIKRITEILDLRAALRMDMTLLNYQNKIRDEYWTVGADAVRDKAADKVVNVRCGAGLDGTTTETVNTMFGAVKLVMSKCPLIRAPISIDLSGIKEENRSFVETYFSVLFNNKPAFVEKYIKTGEFKNIKQ